MVQKEYFNLRFFALLYVVSFERAELSMDRSVQLLSGDLAMAGTELVAHHFRSCMGTVFPNNEGENYAFVRNIFYNQFITTYSLGP